MAQYKLYPSCRFHLIAQNLFKHSYKTGHIFSNQLLQHPPENRLSQPEDEGSLFLQVSKQTFPMCYETPKKGNHHHHHHLCHCHCQRVANMKFKVMIITVMMDRSATLTFTRREKHYVSRPLKIELLRISNES